MTTQLQSAETVANDTPRPAPKSTIHVNVIASTESIDVGAWLDRYAAAIVEANRTGHLNATEAA